MLGTGTKPTIGLALATALLAAALGSLSAASAGEAANAPISGQADSYALSPPAGELPSTGGGEASPAPSRINPLAGEPNAGARGTEHRADVPTDPLATASPSAATRTPDLDLKFKGTANPFACGGCSPPDTIGDVGPDHYVQMVNATIVAVFDKAGNRLDRFDLGSLWPSGNCTGNAGDPVVLYDPIADRWLLSQFATPHHLCFAISQTPDPLGSYHLYTFNVPDFPDYFKVGVWRNAYYVSSNESSYTAYAFDRAKMLAGDPSASFIRFDGETNFLLPADVDGATAPKKSAPGLFYTFKDDSFHGGTDRIELFELDPDFGTPANSTFSMVESIPIAPFTYTVCGFFDFTCARQPGTSQRIDVVSEWPMHRFSYRRFSDHESLLGAFTVGGGTGQVGAAIRWFELRRTGGGWSLYQEGTQDLGDGNDRFMGSIAMDQDGDIALGYSVSSGALFPSIRYATREPGDPLGTLQDENKLQKGGGSQIASDRWGDYSAMSVDPVTDCQFWYTNEYYKSDSGTDWKTAVGAFTVPGCGP